MDILRSLALAAILLLLPAVDASAAELSREARRFTIAGHGALELQVPPDWSQSIETGRDDMPTILTLHAPSSEALLVSIFPNARSEADFTAAARLRSMTEQAGAKL